MDIPRYDLVFDEQKKVQIKEIGVFHVESDIGNFVDHPEKLSCIIREIFDVDAKPEEEAYVIFLRGPEVVGICLLSHGSFNGSFVGSKEIFTRALLLNASYFVLLHTHPSGDPSPSRTDIQITKAIEKACEIMSFYLLDHIIIGVSGEKRYYSFRLGGLLDN